VAVFVPKKVGKAGSPEAAAKRLAEDFGRARRALRVGGYTVLSAPVGVNPRREDVLAGEPACQPLGSRRQEIVAHVLHVLLGGKAGDPGRGTTQTLRGSEAPALHEGCQPGTDVEPVTGKKLVRSLPVQRDLDAFAMECFHHSVLGIDAR